MTTSPPNTHEEWLRRLSAYHSGDGAPEDRAAVEAHLRDCPICQQALTAYQRLYTLASSPLRLGAPSVALARQDTAFPLTVNRSTAMQSPPSSYENSWGDHTTQPSLVYPGGTQTNPHHPTQPPRRRSRWGGLAAALVAAALIIAFIATLGPRFIGQTNKGSKSIEPTVSVTTGPRQTPQTTPVATGSPSPIASPTDIPAPTGFVCANAPGSNATYAYANNTDGQVYEVVGCSAPRKLTNITVQPQPTTGVLISPLLPLAFSPTNTQLMLSEMNQSNGSYCQVIVNTQATTLTQTPFCTPSQYGTWSTWPAFIAWDSDSTFLEANFHPDNSVTIARVNAGSFAQTTIVTFSWAARSNSDSESGMALRNGALFYAGYANGSTTQAALRRYTLATGVDTQLVPLGIAGKGYCQVTSAPCAWTGPWDVSPDGSHIIYHNPAPQQSLSDTTNPPDTPLYYANSDGSGAVKIFDALTPQPNNFPPLIPTTPVFSPNGVYALTESTGGYNVFPDRLCSLATPGSGAVITLPNQIFSTWRSDGAAFVVSVPSSNQYGEFALYTIATGKLTPLTANTGNYLWGN